MTGAVLLLEYLFSSAFNYAWVRYCVEKIVLKSLVSLKWEYEQMVLSED